MTVNRRTRLLEVENLRVVYRRHGQPPVEAVRGVSFQLDCGEAFGIVGESGCGKSSLARALVKLQPLSGGEVVYHGVESGLSARDNLLAYRRGVQMVFQDATGSLNPRMSARQTLEEVLRVHRMRPRERVPARIAELFDLVGLPTALLDAYPRELSGGQCQRISLARCLALEPRLILADEPVSALDVSVQARILNLLRSLQRNLGVALILISHDLAVVRNVCERMAVMHAGEFVETGCCARIISKPQHPYTRTLLEAVPDIRRGIEKERY